MQVGVTCARAAQSSMTSWISTTVPSLGRLLANVTTMMVAIPISAVTGVDSDGVRLNLTKDEVRDLPAVDLDQPE